MHQMVIGELMGRRVWRLPVRFSFAANKPGKSRKPSALLHYSNGRAALGDQHALNRRSSIRYARLPSFHYPVPPSVTIIEPFYVPPAPDRTDDDRSPGLFGHTLKSLTAGWRIYLNEQVFRRPTRLGILCRYGLTPSIVTSPSLS